MLTKDPRTGQIVIQPSRENVRYIDTGKVKIGCAYIRVCPALTDGECHLQGWILKRKPLFKGWW